MTGCETSFISLTSAAGLNTWTASSLIGPVIGLLNLCVCLCTCTHTCRINIHTYFPIFRSSCLQFNPVSLSTYFYCLFDTHLLLFLISFPAHFFHSFAFPLLHSHFPSRINTTHTRKYCSSFPVHFLSLLFPPSLLIRVYSSICFFLYRYPLIRDTYASLHTCLNCTPTHIPSLSLSCLFLHP